MGDEEKKTKWKIAVNKSFDLSHKTVLISYYAFDEQIIVKYDAGLHHWHNNSNRKTNDTGNIPLVVPSNFQRSASFALTLFCQFQSHCSCSLLEFCDTYEFTPIQPRTRKKSNTKLTQNASPMARIRRTFANCVTWKRLRIFGSQSGACVLVVDRMEQWNFLNHIALQLRFEVPGERNAVFMFSAQQIKHTQQNYFMCFVKMSKVMELY